MHPTLQSNLALGMLRRGHRVHGPNLGLLAGQIAGLVGIDVVTHVAGRALSSVAGMVGFDPNNVPGLGGGGVDPGQGGGFQANPTFTTQADKDQAVADAKAQVAAQQQKIAAEKQGVATAQQMQQNAGGDPNDPVVMAFQAQIDGLNLQIAADQAGLAGLQQNLAILQATPVTPLGGGSPAPQPGPGPMPAPSPVPAPVAAAGTPWWKYAVGIAAVGAVGYVAYENY